MSKQEAFSSVRSAYSSARSILSYVQSNHLLSGLTKIIDLILWLSCLDPRKLSREAHKNWSLIRCLPSLMAQTVACEKSAWQILYTLLTRHWQSLRTGGAGAQTTHSTFWTTAVHVCQYGPVAAQWAKHFFKQKCNFFKESHGISGVLEFYL